MGDSYVGGSMRWRRAATRNADVLKVWKAARVEQGQLEADKVVKEVEEKEAKWWVDAVQMMARQMHGEVERDAMMIVERGMKEYWTMTDVAVKEVSEKMRVATEKMRVAWAEVEVRLDEWDEVQAVQAEWAEEMRAV